MSNQAGLGAVIRQHNRLIDRDPHALGYLPGHWEFDLSVDNGALDPPPLDLCQSYGAKGDLVSHPCLFGGHCNGDRHEEILIPNVNRQVLCNVCGGGVLGAVLLDPLADF